MRHRQHRRAGLHRQACAAGAVLAAFAGCDACAFREDDNVETGGQPLPALIDQLLQRLAARMRAEVGRTEGDVAAHTLLAADIKRFLERPTADLQRVIPASAAPPGAPIGDLPQEWLARPPYKQ